MQYDNKLEQSTRLSISYLPLNSILHKHAMFVPTDFTSTAISIFVSLPVSLEPLERYFNDVYNEWGRG